MNDHFDRSGTAIHEAAHAVVAHYFGMKIESVSIVPDFEDESAGRTVVPVPTSLYEDEHYVDFDPDARRKFDERAMQFLAGDIAQQVARSGKYAKVTLAESEAEQRAEYSEIRRVKAVLHDHDLKEALDLAERVSDSNEEAWAYLDQLIEPTRSLLQRHDVWAAVEAVAAALIERSELSGEEVGDVIAQRTSK